MEDPLYLQIAWLIVLAVPVACITWTFTHAELFRELREYFISRNEKGKTLFERKFFFLLICDYCFSHYVAILVLVITRFQLLFDDWRGYFLSWFALVWVANVLINFFSRLYLRLKAEKLNYKDKAHHE
jgi:hypothetical protein